MTFDEALPRLLTAYSKEELVPFTGAGLSAGPCSLWPDFVAGLCRTAGLPGGPGADAAPGELVRLADRAVQLLLNRGEAALQAGVRSALRGADYRRVPPATERLTRVYWPLILTTNYDDWLVGCASAQRWSAAAENRLRVLGRGPADLYEVLTSLYVRSPPLLWALQGFLGGQYREYDRAFRAPYVSAGLERQIVVGHQQYQLVMHREPAFRRAFSEVLRRRSLFFIGSGLQEDYLLNLFGEVQIMHGPGSLPHYALLRASEQLRVAETLFARLNIVPVTYRRHAELPELLGRFAERAAALRGLSEARRYALSLGVGASSGSASGAANGHLTLSSDPLPLPGPDACSVVSVGLAADGSPKLGSSALSFYRAARAQSPDFAPRYEPLPERGAFRVAGLGRVYALAVRAPEGDRLDRRDLRLLAPTVAGFLAYSVAAGYRSVHLPLLAAGEGRDWHPSFCLIETVRGVRLFVAGGGGPLEVHVHIVDPSVLNPLRAGKLFVEENLYCDDLRFWAVLERAHGASDRLLLLRDPACPLGEVAASLGVPEADRWRVAVSPPPTAETRPAPLAELAPLSLTTLGLTNYSTLVFSRVSPPAPSGRDPHRP